MRCSDTTEPGLRSSHPGGSSTAGSADRAAMVVLVVPPGKGGGAGRLGGGGGLSSVHPGGSPESSCAVAGTDAATAARATRVTTTAWVNMDWMSDAVKCNQVLCGYIGNLHAGSGKIAAARLAILSIQAVP